MRMETETTMVWPRAKEHLGPKKLEQARKYSSLDPTEGARPCRHLDFRPLAFRTTKEYISVVVSHPVCGSLSRQLQEAHTQGHSE